ncbi:MAG: polysaccharide biosynthesis protein, partial [Pseudomonadota bacterium]
MKTEILTSIDSVQGRLSARFFRSKVLTSVTHLPRRTKQIALVTFDLVALTACLWTGFYLRLETFLIPASMAEAAVLLAGPVSLVAVFIFTGLYRYVTRYFGPDAITRAALTAVVGTALWQLVVALIDPAYVVPRSVIVFYAITATLTVWGSRHIIGWILRNADMAQQMKAQRLNARAGAASTGAFGGPTAGALAATSPALIYGANDRGHQLGAALLANVTHSTLLFVDDDDALWGRRIGGYKVFSPENIGDLIARKGVRNVYLALPDGPRSERRAIVQRLEKLNVQVKTLPSFADITSGRVAVQDLQPVDINDLLGRDRVPADPDLLHRSIVGKVVMVTGAGGSIGSEIARQVAEQSPAHLVLYELSELSLFQIEGALRAIFGDTLQLSAVLGSVNDDEAVQRALRTHGVQTIYHAAAYKHVPIVELNPAAGVRNNTFGTRTLAQAAKDCGVERFVLISTDKAVRPTNIMGASKRLAEQVLQSLASEVATRADDAGPATGRADSPQRDAGNAGTIFTMVRFGNVLASSGSVVHT